MDDDALLDGLRRGAPNAWSTAYSRFFRRAYAAAAALSPSDREEVASQAVQGLLPYLNRVERLEELDALAATLGHHLAVSRIRRETAGVRGGGRVGSLDEHLGDGADWADTDVPGPDAVLDQAQRAARIHEALARLRPPFGELLRDRYLHGQDYQALASAYGLSIDSIGVYLSRAKAALREVLEGMPGGLNEIDPSRR